MTAKEKRTVSTADPDLVRRVEPPVERVRPGAKRRTVPNEYWQERFPVEQRYRQYGAEMTAAGHSTFREQLGLDKVPALPQSDSPAELVECVADYLAKGGLLRDWCRITGVPEARVRRAIKVTGSAERIAEARREGADALAEDALAIASTPVNLKEVIETVGVDGEVLRTEVRSSDALQARKLAYQARVTLAAKWAPDRYGDKIEVKTDASAASSIAAFRKRLRSQSYEDLEAES